MTRATLAKDPAQVAAMFDRVARRYDRTNSVLSLGLDRTWRHAVRAALDLHPGERVLDLAAGTATSSSALARTGAVIVGCDFSLEMLRVGNAHAYDRVRLAAGNALALPFADACFDAVTISFGLRNTADADLALREMQRVTRPGGRLVICEFSHPTWAPLCALYMDHVLRLLPPVTPRVGSDPEAYIYLAESIRAWPRQADLATRLTTAGWQDAAWRDLTGGIVALHTARRPAVGQEGPEA